MMPKHRHNSTKLNTGTGKNIKWKMSRRNSGGIRQRNEQYDRKGLSREISVRRRRKLI